MLCRAAELTDATVNQFLVQAALKEAQVAIEREDVIRLSIRGWNWLLDLMEKTPQLLLPTRGGHQVGVGVLTAAD